MIKEEESKCDNTIMAMTREHIIMGGDGGLGGWAILPVGA